MGVGSRGGKRGIFLRQRRGSAPKMRSMEGAKRRIVATRKKPTRGMRA
jgi:hypothetical protein